MNVRSERSHPCRECHGWFDGPLLCQVCHSRRRKVEVCWSLQLDSLRIALHRLLAAGLGRERRGKIELPGISPEIAFALLDFFSWPDPAVNRGGHIYKPGHSTYKKVTNNAGNSCMIQFTYNDMEHVNWAFPLHDMYPATSYGATRLAKAGRFTDLRSASTPMRFRYKWATPSCLGGVGRGVHLFSIHFNITHFNGHDGQPRFNFGYQRWTAEQQQQIIVHTKQSLRLWPSRPLRSTHALKCKANPLADWARTPTPLGPTIQNTPPENTGCSGAAEGASSSDTSDDNDDFEEP